MSAPAEESTGYHPAGWLRLTVALALAVHSWAVHLGLTYLVVPETCAAGAEWVLHTITLGTALGCGVGLWVAAALLRRANEVRDRDRYARRDAYLGWVGVAMSAFFLAVTVVEGIPALFISPCL